MLITNQISYLDSVLKEYGDVSYIFHYAAVNGLDNIQGFFSAGTEVIVDDFRVTIPIAPVPVTQPSNYATISIKGVQNQNLFDLSTRYFGSLLNVVNLAYENGLSINDSVTHKEILINNYNKKTNFVNYFESFNTVLTTNFTKKSRSFNISFNISFD